MLRALSLTGCSGRGERSMLCVGEMKGKIRRVVTLTGCSGRDTRITLCIGEMKRKLVLVVM